MKLNLKFCLSCLVLCLSLFSSKAQNCKYVEEKKDAFTNEVTKMCNFSIGKGGRIALLKKADKYYVSFFFIVSGFIEKKLYKGDTVYIKLADEKMAKIAFPKDLDPVLNGSNGSAYTSWGMDIEVDPKIIKRLANHDMIAIKVVINETDVVYNNFTSKLVERLKDSALCLVSE